MCLIQMCIGLLPRSGNRCRTIATFVLFFANVIILFAGLCLVGFGLISLLLQGAVLAALPFQASMNLVAATAIAIGALVYVIAILGFCSAWKQWRNLLVPYVIFVAVLLIAKICVAVATWDSMESLQVVTYQWLVDAFQDPAHRDTFHLLEMSMQCCGAHGFFSYHILGLDLPYTCCDMPAFPEIGETCDAHQALRGCADVISDILQLIAHVANFTLLYAVTVETLALISSVYLLRTSTEKPQLLYTIVPSNNLDPDRTRVEMDEIQLVTSQPGPQVVYEPCEVLV